MNSIEKFNRNENSEAFKTNNVRKRKIKILIAVLLLSFLSIGFCIHQYIETARYNKIYNDMVDLMYFSSFDVTSLSASKLIYVFKGNDSWRNYGCV